MGAKRKESRCKVLTRAGKPCRAAATAGGLCYFHANPNKASELGRKGGKSKRPAVGENFDPLPRLDKAIAVRDTLARLIADVHAGKLETRIATALGPLLGLQLRAIETTDLERRIVELEKRSAEVHRAEASNGEGDESWREAGDLAASRKQ